MGKQNSGWRKSFQRTGKRMTMQKLRIGFTTAGLVLASAMLCMPKAHAGDTVCSGSLGAVTIDGSVAVPDGRTCTLKGTRVKGNIFVYTGATLSANRVRVDGNIQSEGARAVYVNPGSIVGGNIQIKQGRAARIDQVRIGGDLQLFQNRDALRAVRNEVDGNLQADENTGGLTISYNSIDGALQCKQNRPAPRGTGNVAGDKEGQCAWL
jgi:hypothetical protein